MIMDVVREREREETNHKGVYLQASLTLYTVGSAYNRLIVIGL